MWWKGSLKRLWVLTESPAHHNQHKTKCPKAAQAHGHQQSSANATATGLLSECHGVDVKTGAKEKHLKSMSLKGLANWTVQAPVPQVASWDDQKTCFYSSLFLNPMWGEGGTCPHLLNTRANWMVKISLFFARKSWVLKAQRPSVPLVCKDPKPHSCPESVVRGFMPQTFKMHITSEFSTQRLLCTFPISSCFIFPTFCRHFDGQGRP